MAENAQTNNPLQAHATSSSQAQGGETPTDDLQFTNAPNLLTLARVLFVPLVVGALFMRTPGWDLVAAILFGIASFTDYLDGYLARSRKQITVYGQLMDPLADKFLVVSALIMLQELDRIHPVVVILLICREMAITGLRALASSEGVVIAASASAKWKTATQMVAIPFLMVRQGIFGIPLYALGQILLYVSLAISLWSAQTYVVDFFRGLREARKQKVAQRRLVREARIAARNARMAAKARAREQAREQIRGPTDGRD